MGRRADTACGEAAVVGVVRGPRGACPPRGGAAERGSLSGAPASGRGGAHAAARCAAFSRRAGAAAEPRVPWPRLGGLRSPPGAAQRKACARDTEEPRAPDRPGQSQDQASGPSQLQLPCPPRSGPGAAVRVERLLPGMGGAGQGGCDPRYLALKPEW